MQLVAPDILVDGRGLSVPVCVAGLAVGAIVWLFGGLGHRFWIVLLTTVIAGAYGLSIGEAFGVQPLVSALLLAVAGGVLALALVRVGAFLAGGVVACVLAERVVPGWNEPFVFFFVGGFLGLVLLRFWCMVLSSLGGTLVMAHCLLWLLDTMEKIDCLDWCNNKPVLLNWACGGTALLGLLIQVGIHRRLRPRKGDEDEEGRRPLLLRWLPGGDRRRRRAA